MPDIKYFITTGDGHNHQVSEDNIKNYGIDSYANAYKDATIRMRNDKGEDYHIPLSNYQDAVEQGLHPFRFDAAPQSGKEQSNDSQPAQAGNVAREVVQEYENSLHNNPQPSRQVKPSNIPSYLDRDRTESVVQDRSSWANNDFSKLGVNKVHDINTNIQRQQAQDNQPVVHTGVPQENQYIIKTQGQQRQQAEESANNLNDKFISPYVDEALTAADKQARDVIDKSQHLFYGSSTGLPQGDVYHAAGMEDPDKILKGLQDNISKVYSDPAFIQNVNQEANKIGISAQDYYSKYVEPKIQNQLESTFEQKEILKHMPKNKAEYLINGLTNGITGMVLSRLLPQKEVQFMNAAQQATDEGQNENYTPTTGDKLEKFAVSFTTDAPFFGLTGKVASSTVGAVAKNQIEKLTAKGLAEGTARSIIGTQLENSVGKRVASKILQGSISGAVNLGTYNVMNESARQIRDREFSPTQILERGASGLGTGAALGVTGGIVGGLTSKLSGAKKLLASAASYLTEAGTFTATGEAEKFLKGEGKNIRWGQDFLENVEQLGIMKATGGHFVERMKNLVNPESTGVHFTKDEINNIRSSQSANSLFSALADMQPSDSKFIKGENTENIKDPNIQSKRENLSKAYTDFMKDPNNTFTEKQKIAITLGGTVPENIPLETGYKIDNTDNGSAVTTTDANGNAIQRYAFKTEDEANKFASEHQNAIKSNAVQDMGNNYPEEVQRLYGDFMRSGYNEDQINNALAGEDNTPEGTKLLGDFQQRLSDRINQVNSFDQGLLTTDAQGRQQIKAQLDEQSTNVSDQFKDEPNLLNSLNDNPEPAIQKMRDEGYSEEKINSALDYLSAKNTYLGMMKGVRDEIDEKVNKNNEKINSITNQTDGLLHPATMRDGDPIYIISGNVSMSDDGTIDHENSDKAIIIRDPETGEQKMISPMFLGSLDQAINSEDYAKQQEEEIRNYYSQKDSDEIEGNGQITTDNENQVTVPQAEEQNLPQTDESNVSTEASRKPQDNPDNGQDNGLKQFVSDDGKTIIPAKLEDGTEVFLKDPSQNANNKFSNVDIMYKDEDGNPQTESIPASYIKEIGPPQMLEDYLTPKEDMLPPEKQTETPATDSPSNSEKDGLARDEKGMPLYEQSPIESTISDMKKQGADENDILDYSSNMISELEKESKELSKKKPEFSRDFATYKANKQALADQKEAVEKQKAYWKDISDAISKPAEPAESKSPSYNKTSETPIIPTDSKQRNTGKYVKENKQMGDYLNLHDRVLRGIASGTKFLWNDDGVKKGVSTELGFKGSEGERKKRIGLLASKDKGGVSIDELAHNIWEEREGQPWQNDDVTDIKNEIISVLLDNNGTRSMIDEAMKMHEEPDEGDDSYEAQNYIAGLANSRHIDPDDMQEFDSNIDNETKNNYEASSDGELYRIFAEKYLKDDENKINDKENGKGKDGKTKGVLEQIPTGENTDSSSAGGNSILPQERSSSEGKTRSGSERKSSKNDNVRSNEDGNNVLSDGSVSRAGEDQSRPKLDQYEPISQTAKDKAKELDLDIEKQSNAVSKANKIVERKREEISSRNGLFGDTKSTELFNETSDLSNDSLHKALDKYIKDYDFEKNKLDNLLAGRDKTLKDIDDAESKQVDMFTSETPEEANVKRMSDIEERLSDIDSLITDHEDNNTSDALDMISLNKEKKDLESEYKGLKDVNSESKNTQERKFSAPIIENESPLEYAQKVAEAHERFKEEQKTNTNPSEAQKEAGNYKKGHIKLDGYDITIENPKGSERSGKDADGKEWHTKMNNTYGYIRGTESVDGDHIDIYLSDDPTKGDVYVVDQVNPETGEFDEHKVMYGFPSALAAKRAYLSNYEKNWKGLGKITNVSKEDFKKWVDSSHRKTKPFNEYKFIKPIKTIEDLIREANGGKDEGSTKNAQDILKSRGIDWTNETINNKNIDTKRLKKIKDAKYELMNAKRELSVATSKNSPYTESEIEEKRRLVKEAEDHLKELLGNRKEDSESKGIRFSIKNKENFDKRYFEAINNGNMEEAQRIIDNAASLSEYSNLKDYEYAHKAPNSGGINKEDFRNLEKFRDVVDNGEEYPNLYVIGNGISSVPGDFFTPNGHRFYSEETPSDLESFRNIEKAIHNMKDQLSKYGEVKDIPMVRVYRAVPNSVKEGSVRNGGWVTPSKKYAEIHKENNLPGKGKIIEQDVPADQLWWDGNSINEWGYDDGNNYAYRDTKNNKKLLDVITKDDKGNIISPSKRFNIRNNDIRFNIKEKSDSQDTQLRDALIEKIRNSGIEVITDNEGQNILDKKLKESPEDGIKYSIREKPSPRETGIGYKVFVLKDGKLYPPMVANPNGESTPTGIWLDADSAKIAGSSKTGRPQVKAGGKGTQGGSGKLAYRPGWHLGEIPYALQFNRVNPESGERELFPSNFVWAEVEYSKDVDYQKEAHDEGINENGNYQHSLAGLKHVPEDGSYRYRTNPNPETDEWIITGSMKVNKILSRDEVNNIVKEAGREPQKIQKDDQITQDKVDELNKESENIRYFLTPNGEAYGFVKDGKIYIDTNIAGADTPIHEYTHLWAEVIRKENPEEWKNIVSLMKELPIWNEIKDRYTNLKNDDDLADEVLATYSGTRGAKKLIEEKNNLLASESSIFSKAKIVDIFNRFKMAIDRYWHHVADFLNIHYTSAEEVADQALKDLLNGVNPNNEMLHSNLSDENYIKTLDAEDEDISDELEDKYHDDGEKKLTSENIGPILYNMSGRYTKLINMRGVPGMVVHDNETDFNQAILDYCSVSILGMYQNKLREMLPRCTDAAKERVQKVIDGIDYTLRYYERQADGEEMWRTADQPMFRTAYHGTDKDFDQFDLNHLGEGQGQNIAGNGIYVSDVKGVASKIKDMSKGDGYLYKVNIPDDTGSNYLDWNKTYKGEELQGIVDRIFKAVDGTKDASIKESNSFLNEQLSKHPEGVTGSSLYTLVRFSVDNPSNVLNKAGFVGTKYNVNMDKGYRDTLKGNVLSKLGKKSYSIFNEKDVKILQKEKDESQAKETMPIGKKTEEQISSIKSSVDSVSDKLGGMPVNYVDESNIPDNVKDKIDSTTKGWYDPKDGSVTLYTPNITSEDDAVRTVFHEKLGHEGLKALFGSDSEVNKFGDFIFKSANKELRDEITKEAGRNGFPLNNPDGMSHAAQEVFARIAEEGPASENEFSLWRKIKHYVIDLLNKSGLHIKGILSDKDLRYYIKKTAEALKNQKLSEGSSEVMFRKEDEPKKMKGENMRQFIDRLREYNKIEEARMDKEDPMPEYHPLDSGDFAKDAAAQSKYYDDYRQWKIRHNIYDIEKADDKFYNGEDDVIADPVKDKDIYLNSMDNARLEADPKAIERYAKTDIIERRKLINGSAAEDSLFMKDISDRTDAIAKSLNTTGKDIREALPFMIEGTYHGPIKVNEELETLMDDIKSWHDEMYNFLKEEGLYGEVGYLNNYISHIWDSEKSDAKAFENFVRTKNKYMQHRLVPTYQDGIDLGLVPKYKDVTEIMAEYGKTCAESVANNRLINAFKNYDIVDGDRRDPALSTISAPGYTRISVPGISDYPMADIWVHNSIKDRFNSVFGGKRTQGIPNWLTKAAHTLDLSASVMKKINLSVSGFHAVALTETLVGTEGPARALRDVAKYVIKESAFKGLPPAYAHPEDYKLAAKHLVRLGATDDYSMAEVQAITSKMRKIVEDFDKKHPRLSDSPVTFAAQTLDFMNKGFDTVLWKYIHDGFKLSGFKYYANNINKDFKDGKINGIERDKRLDEAGQMINDAFGGQFWDVINVSPSLLKWMGRGLLSPDWTISTTRHGLSAMFGLGSLYSESGFQNYLFNNTKRMLGKDIPKNEYVDMRKKWGRQFYAIAFMAIGTMMNAINAYYRHKDEQDEKEKADEMRKSNPDYKSPYELAYPDGMKWYDYTMYGNSVGHQTHLFSGHYQDGTETYVRWGKQLREIPEMLYGRDGFSFPGPIIDRLSGKANPIINLTSNLFSGASLNGFDNPYMKNKRGWAKEIGRLHVIASCFLPYSIPTDEEKEFKMTDLFMPSQKGMTKWSTINHFKTAILSGDLDYVGQTYKAAVLNGIDAEACLKAATTEVKAGQRQEMSDGIKSLQVAMDSFDNAKTLDEKKHLKAKIVKYLADSGYKSFSQQEAVDKVKDFLNGDDLKDNEVNSDKYIMEATADDIRGDYKISALNKKALEITNKVQEMYSEGESPETIQQYVSHYKKWFEIKGITAGYKSQTNSIKKLIGKEKNAMDMIRSCREETMKRINSVN